MGAECAARCGPYGSLADLRPTNQLDLSGSGSGRATRIRSPRGKLFACVFQIRHAWCVYAYMQAGITQSNPIHACVDKEQPDGWMPPRADASASRACRPAVESGQVGLQQLTPAVANTTRTHSLFHSGMQTSNLVCKTTRPPTSAWLVNDLSPLSSPQGRDDAGAKVPSRQAA